MNNTPETLMRLPVSNAATACNRKVSPHHATAPFYERSRLQHVVHTAAAVCTDKPDDSSRVPILYHLSFARLIYHLPDGARHTPCCAISRPRGQLVRENTLPSTFFAVCPCASPFPISKYDSQCSAAKWPTRYKISVIPVWRRYF